MSDDCLRGLRRLDPIEFRKQYEGTWEPPGPLSDAELERMERRYRDHKDAYRLTMEVRRLHDALAAAEARAAVAEKHAAILAKHLSGFDVTEDGEVRDEDGEPFPDDFIVNIGMQAAGIKEIHAALAAADTAPPREPETVRKENDE